MKATRKNPFAQATPYSMPSQSADSHFSQDIAEDPGFQQFSSNNQGFKPANNPPRPNQQNPFGNQPNGGGQEDFSDFNAPNQNFGSNQLNNQPQFANSGWKTGENKGDIFNQGSMNDTQQNVPSSGYAMGTGPGDQNMMDSQSEPPLLEGKLIFQLFHF
jgi:hypothetical protein